MEQCSRLLDYNNLQIERCHLDVVKDADNGTVTFMRFLITENGEKGDITARFPQLEKDAKRLKW